TSDGSQIAHERLVDGRGLLVVATGNEYELLKRLAQASGVELADSSKLLSTPDDVPAPFHELARRLAGPLQARGVPSVEFFCSPELELFPACLRIRSERKNSTWNAVDANADLDDEEETTLGIDALLL